MAKVKAPPKKPEHILKNPKLKLKKKKGKAVKRPNKKDKK